MALKSYNQSRFYLICYIVMTFYLNKKYLTNNSATLSSQLVRCHNDPPKINSLADTNTQIHEVTIQRSNVDYHMAKLC